MYMMRPQRGDKQSVHPRLHNKIFVHGGRWRSKSDFCTTQSEEESPSSTVDFSFILEHSATSTIQQSDTIRQMNYMFNWTQYVEKHIDT